MKQHGKLQLIKGRDSEVVNLRTPDVLFYAEDTDKHYIYDGKEAIEIGSGGGGSPDAVVSITDGEPVGSKKIINIVEVTQAQYNLGPKNNGTVYLITDD